MENISIEMNSNPEFKTLFVNYDLISDIFKYSPFESIKVANNITKRHILKNASRIFDPLGLLAPCTIVPKLLIQKTWKENLDWDDPLPMHLKTDWLEFVDNIKEINSVTIPRQVFLAKASAYRLHGFSDASESAYGACVYVESIMLNKNIACNLLTAKTRIAPIRCVTLPRLELCAATLLAQLVDRVIRIMDINFESVLLWSDSKITLAWIKSCPSRWKTFVANRVAEIHRLTDPKNWFYVNSKNNPADLLTRGISFTELKDNKKWWFGPHLDIRNASEADIISQLSNIPEQKIVSLKSVNLIEFDLFARYSRLQTLVNVHSYCRRFIFNCKHTTKISGELTVEERSSALLHLVKLAQRQSFSQDINKLLHKKSLDTSSNLLCLKPILDDEGILRVGGRLKNADIDFDQKHQIILPRTHKLTELIAVSEHLRNKHCGQQQLLYTLRERYWPISGNSLAKKITKQCIQCFKSQPKSYAQIMGNLPKSRVTPSPPFCFCGVDYAGPFYTKDRRVRGYRKHKAYVCLFICFNTRAIHIEVVNDLSAESFIASLRRFISRRGRPHTIYSDNGTNFTAANKELQYFKNAIVEYGSKITRELVNFNINWKFIPPRSPHFGGIWESNIKSIKRHLTKTIAETVLTMDEFNTLLCQIEAVVNSRPISPLSSDPNDLIPLTPAHFLIGRSLQSLPDRIFVEEMKNPLSYYRKVQEMVHCYWKRWQREYLHQLQQRPKWQRETQQPLQVGSLIVLKEDNTPPTSWRMGRVTQLWPGTDGIVRVVSIKTANCELKRTINKICVLPIENYV